MDSLKRDEPVTNVDQIRAQFAQFAHDYPDLPLYHRLSSAIAEDDEVASLLLAARPGQARPVLLLAALHDFVLAHPDCAGAKWFASVNPEVPEGDPWDDVRATLLDNTLTIRDTVSRRTTQTNEANRAAYLLPSLMRGCADVPDEPVVLLELGCSAGLLLLADRFDVQVGAARFGDAGSPVVCRGDDRSHPQLRSEALPTVVARHGLDLHPVSVDDPAQLRWLEACLWPDVPGRVERFRAAAALAQLDPPTLHRGSMVEDLADAVRFALDGHDEAHLVVFCSWALTYVDRPSRTHVLDTVAQIGRTRNVTWLTAEPPGGVPGIDPPDHLRGQGGTVLGAHRWRRGQATAPETLGTCHAHGEWVDLGGMPLTQPPPAES